MLGTAPLMSSQPPKPLSVKQDIGRQAYRDSKLDHLSVRLHGLISQAVAHAALQECVVRHTVWPQACFLQLSKPALSSPRSKVYTKAMQTWIDQATFA